MAIHAQHHAYRLPQALCSFIVHICKLKGPRGHPWQLESLGTMQGAEHPHCFLRAIWKCLLFHGLFNVLFIYSCMAFFEICEGIIKQKYSYVWVAETLPWNTSDDCASGSRAQGPSTWLDCWSAPNQLLWVLRWEFGLINPISGLEIFPWLCYVLRPLGKSATCSF